MKYQDGVCVGGEIKFFFYSGPAVLPTLGHVTNNNHFLIRHGDLLTSLMSRFHRTNRQVDAESRRTIKTHPPFRNVCRILNNRRRFIRNSGSKYFVWWWESQFVNWNSECVASFDHGVASLG